MVELRLRWQGELLRKTKHPAHWLVNVLRQKTTYHWLPAAFGGGQIDMIGPGHRTHIPRLLKRGNKVVTHSNAQPFLPPKTQPDVTA